TLSIKLRSFALSSRLMKIPSWHGQKASSFWGGSFWSGTPPPCTPEGVKEFKTGRDREGEAPAEPSGARTCWGDGSAGASPSHFFHTFPSKGQSDFPALALRRIRSLF